MTAPSSETAVVVAVRRPRPGQVLAIKGEPTMLWSRCSTFTAALYCVPCNQTLANQGQLEMHTETGDNHVIVRWCTRHGWESAR